MIKVNVIAVGKLKEKYLREACNEYVKRLGAFSKVSVVEVSEERCSDNPSPSEIETVKDKEGKRIIAKILKSSLKTIHHYHNENFQAFPLLHCNI